MTLHTPTGARDILNTATLIGLIHPAESGCNLFTTRIKPMSSVKGSFDPKDIIPISKHQLLVVQP